MNKSHESGVEDLHALILFSSTKIKLVVYSFKLDSIKNIALVFQIKYYGELNGTQVLKSHQN